MTSENTMAPGPAGGGESRKKGEGHQFTVGMELVRDYRFRVQFGKDHYPELLMDEPPPLGGDSGPSASRVLAAAVGDCLSASLLFCLRKARVDIPGVRTNVAVHFTRNERGRLRIGKIEVEIAPLLDAANKDKAQRCLELFEDYCVVTQSVRNGIDISVNVRDAA